MTDFKWYLNRLRAMSAAEIRWRLNQKRWEKTERQTFAEKNRKIRVAICSLSGILHANPSDTSHMSIHPTARCLPACLRILCTEYQKVVFPYEK